MNIDIEEAKTELERMTRELADAVNRRDFDEASIWRHVPRFFRRGDHDGSIYGRYRDNAAWGMSFPGMIKDFCAEHPDFCVTIRSINAEIFSRIAYGEVFVNADLSGWQPGLVQPTVTRLEYRVVDCRWRLIRHELFQGSGE